MAADVGLPVTFTLAIGNAGTALHLDALRMVEKANDNGGEISAQIFPRPIGLVIGLDLSGNPFMTYPSYQEIAHLPLAERVAEMRKPEVRQRILADKPGSNGHPLMFGRRPGTTCTRSAIRRTTSRHRPTASAHGPWRVG